MFEKQTGKKAQWKNVASYSCGLFYKYVDLFN